MNDLPINVNLKDQNARRSMAAVMDTRDEAAKQRLYGPWLVVHGRGWDCFLDTTYLQSKDTLKQRMRQIDTIGDVVLDVGLPDDAMVLREV